MTTTAPLRSHEDLLALAMDDDERAFVEEAITFLRARVARREPELLRWGVGDEGLTIFHETSGRGRTPGGRARPRRGRPQSWAAGFGWLTGPAELRRPRHCQPTSTVCTVPSRPSSTRPT